MVFNTFVMAAKEAYFFNSPTHWAWRNLPADVEALFIQQPPIKDVIEFALGENGAYFLSYRDAEGKVCCRHYNLPNSLTAYLYTSGSVSQPYVIRDLPTLSVSLGPYNSYYAHDRSSASWSNLPPSLEKALLSRLVTGLDSIYMDRVEGTAVWKGNGIEAPSFVSLGAAGAYFMRTVRGGGAWDLKVGKQRPVGAAEGNLSAKDAKEGLRGINGFLEGAVDFSGVAGLYLFPHYPASYILLLTSGKVFSNLPEHTWTDYNKMAPALPATKQSPLPIPPVPQRPGYEQYLATTPQSPTVFSNVQQPISGPSSQQHRPNCCPPNRGGNCCPPPPGTQTMQAQAQSQSQELYYGGAGAWYPQAQGQQVGYASGSAHFGGGR